VWVVATGLYYEERANGTRTLARDEILAAVGQHGDWERFSSPCVRYEVRRSREAKALVRAALEQELDMRAAYWPGHATRPPADTRYIPAVPAEHPTAKPMPQWQAEPAPAAPAAAATEPLVASVPKFPHRAKWLENRLAERGWDKHDLQRHGGPEHRTTQKILNGSNVQDDVLRRVINGLQSKPNHKGRALPAVKESDIPRD
jgi:hypothetical protein